MLLYILVLEVLLIQCISFHHHHHQQHQHQHRLWNTNTNTNSVSANANVNSNNNAKKNLLTERKKGKGNDNNDSNEIDEKYVIKENVKSSSSPPSSLLSNEPQRRIKKNKYAEFSKKAIDPIEETIINNKKKGNDVNIIIKTTITIHQYY